MKKIYFLLLLSYINSLGQTQIGLDIDGEFANDRSGSSVSLSSDGSIVAIGAFGNDGNGTDSGHVRVYQNISGIWTQIGLDIDGEFTDDQSGSCVSLSSDGSVVAIGSHYNDGNGTDSGHVRIFRNISGIWTQIGLDIDGETSNDFCGRSVSLSSDGNVVAIGAPGNDANGINSGHVLVFRNISGVWTQLGTDINGEATGDLSGSCVSLSSDGNLVAIGAFGNDGNGTDSGHVRVFRNISGIWTQLGTDINGEATGDLSGSCVSLSSDGNLVAIGAYGNDENGINSGHVRVFRNILGIWTKIGDDINGEASGDNNGRSVSLSSDGSLVAIGAIYNNENGVDSGSVKVYLNTSGTWTQIGANINGEASFTQSGWSVSLSDTNLVAIGALFNNGTGDYAGHVRVFDLSTVLSSNNFVLDNFSIYPSPAKSVINIITDKNNYEIEIIDIQGKIIHSQKTFGLSTVINISNFEKGIYFLNLINGTQKTTKKFIIE